MVDYVNGASNNGSWDPTPAGNIQGICPAGWHLPTIEEWNTVIQFAGGAALAGGYLKEKGVSHWAFPNNGASNTGGFSALPSGIRDSDGNFASLSSHAYFWSSSETYSEGAWGYFMNNEFEFIAPVNSAKTNGYSVRCVKD
jgi:uncharacterized protein (TIGR02145 family)